MAVLRILSRLGDSRLEWDADAVAQGDAEAMAAVQEAERIFATERSRGSVAFRIFHGRPAQRMDSFDPAADDVVIVPRVAGG